MTIDYEGLANAALVFVTGLILWFGGRKGLAGGKAAQPEPEQKTLKLDMAMVDNREIKALAGTLEAVNMTLVETNKLITREINEREFDEEVERRIKERLGK